MRKLWRAWSELPVANWLKETTVGLRKARPELLGRDGDAARWALLPWLSEAGRRSAVETKTELIFVGSKQGDAGGDPPPVGAAAHGHGSEEQSHD